MSHIVSVRLGDDFAVSSGDARTIIEWAGTVAWRHLNAMLRKGADPEFIVECLSELDRSPCSTRPLSWWKDLVERGDELAGLDERRPEMSGDGWSMLQVCRHMPAITEALSPPVEIVASDTGPDCEDSAVAARLVDAARKRWPAADTILVECGGSRVSMTFKTLSRPVIWDAAEDAIWVAPEDAQTWAALSAEW